MWRCSAEYLRCDHHQDHGEQRAQQQEQRETEQGPERGLPARIAGEELRQREDAIGEGCGHDPGLGGNPPLERNQKRIQDERLHGQERGDDQPLGVVDVLESTESELERSEEHTSELQSLMRNSYAVVCLNTKK